MQDAALNGARRCLSQANCNCPSVDRRRQRFGAQARALAGSAVCTYLQTRMHYPPVEDEALARFERITLDFHSNWIFRVSSDADSLCYRHN